MGGWARRHGGVALEDEIDFDTVEIGSNRSSWTDNHLGNGLRGEKASNKAIADPDQADKTRSEICMGLP